MNYYNPYFYNMPTTMTAAKTGLFSRMLGGKGITLGGILNGTQRVLSFANQAIPLVKQVKPMVGNAKTMFRVMNEFKRVEKPTKTNNNISSTNKVNENNTTTETNIENNTIEKTNATNTDNGPTFFI